MSARLQRINPRVRGDSLAHVVFGYRDTTAVLDISWKAHGLAQGSVLLVGDAGEAFFEGRMTRGDVSRYRVASGNTVVLDEQRSPTVDYLERFPVSSGSSPMACSAARYPFSRRRTT